jgi:hypothetical protein
MRGGGTVRSDAMRRWGPMSTSSRARRRRVAQSRGRGSPIGGVTVVESLSHGSRQGWRMGCHGPAGRGPAPKEMFFYFFSNEVKLVLIQKWSSRAQNI